MDCPECTEIIQDDPQYQCTTCEGSGVLEVLEPSETCTVRVEAAKKLNDARQRMIQHQACSDLWWVAYYDKLKAENNLG